MTNTRTDTYTHIHIHTRVHMHRCKPWRETDRDNDRRSTLQLGICGTCHPIKTSRQSEFVHPRIARRERANLGIRDTNDWNTR